jgi:hypothetical protein
VLVSAPAEFPIWTVGPNNPLGGIMLDEGAAGAGASVRGLAICVGGGAVVTLSSADGTQSVPATKRLRSRRAL